MQITYTASTLTAAVLHISSSQPLKVNPNLILTSMCVELH
jgi:hypothetical protein